MIGMFREMRRKKQELDGAACREILERGSSGTLALMGDEGYPYAVPISYVYDGADRLYFHGAWSGHKLDAIRRCEKASFCVIDRDDVVPEMYTTKYQSVIVFGKIRVIEDAEPARCAARLLGRKYHPGGSAQGLEEELDKTWKALCMMEFVVEHMTGKRSIELLREAQGQ